MDGDPIALGSERPGDGGPDPAGGARDQDRASGLVMWPGRPVDVTSASNKWRRVPAGSSVRPGVDLRGLDHRRGRRATQPKRSDGSSAATGPPGGVAADDRAAIASSCGWIVAGSRRGRARARRAGSSSIRAPRKPQLAGEQDDADVDALAALDPGTTRRIVYWKSRYGAGTLGLRHERARLGQALAQERREVAAAARPGRRPATSSGTRRDRVRRSPARRARREPLVGLGDRAGARQQHVVADHREGRAGASRRSGASPCWRKNAAPWSISQVRRVPDEQVGVAGRAVDVGDERVEPDDVGGELGVEVGGGGGRERQRAREEVDAEVGADARLR